MEENSSPPTPRDLLRIRLLGVPSVVADGEIISSFRSSRIPALFGLLASKLGGLRREYVAETLWPDKGAGEGRHNLRQTLLYIKQQFGPDFIFSDRNTVELSPTIETDLGLVLRASASLQSPAQAEQTANDAIKAYRGEFLEGFDDDWILAVRIQLAKAYVEAILFYSDCCIKTNPKRALELAELAIAAEPFLDGARARKLRALVAMGEHASAHREYGAYKKFLAAELGIDPSSLVQDALDPTAVFLLPAEESLNLVNVEGAHAVTTLIHSNRPVRGLDLAIAYAPYWAGQNLAKEGIAIVQQALEANQGSPRSDSFLLGNVAQAELLVASGHAYEAKEILAKSLPFLTNPTSHIRALNLYARIFTFSYRPREGNEYISKAVSLARNLGAKEEQIDALRYASEIAFQLEDLAAAESYAKESLPLCQEIGDWNSQASVRGQIAMIQERSGNSEESRKTIHIGLRELEGKSSYRATFTRGRFARLLEEIGDVVEAEVGYRRAIAEARTFDDPRGFAVNLTYLGDILTTQSLFDEALRCHEEALAIRQKVVEQLGEATSLRGIGRIYLATNRLKEAQEFLKESSRLYLVAGVVPGHVSVLYELARVANEMGDTNLALRIATQARHLMLGMSKLSLQTIGPGSQILLQQTEALVKEFTRQVEGS
jgi:DNA-binding SARP family transcriptional activator